MTTPDNSKNGIAPETLMMIGIFHKVLTDPHFGRLMIRYALENEECAEQFGIKRTAPDDPETVQ